MTARRIEKLNEIEREILRAYPDAKICSFQMDVRNSENVGKVVGAIPKDFYPIDVLVNNAGLAIGVDKIENVGDDAINQMIDTNVKGLLFVTRAVLPQLKNKVGSCVINVGSVAGSEAYPGGGVYCASKHAVDAITRALRMELVDSGVRVASICPGMVETEFSIVRFSGDHEKAKNVYSGLKSLTALDVAESIAFVASRPDHVQIADILMFPVNQASALVIHRNK